MRALSWALCVWPGLPQLWQRGSWTGLAVAVFSGALLNATLIASFVWTGLLGNLGLTACWAAVALLWGGSALVAGVLGYTGQALEVDPATDLYPRAINEYLGGNWFEAEALCVRILQLDAGDVDARLMQATVYRHTGRHEEARQKLSELTRLEGVAKWELEIQRELELLDAAVIVPGRRQEPAAANETIAIAA